MESPRTFHAIAALPNLALCVGILSLWLAIASVGKCYLKRRRNGSRYRPADAQEFEWWFRSFYSLSETWHLKSLSFDWDADGLSSVVSISFVFAGETIRSHLAIVEDMRDKRTLSFQKTVEDC